MFAWFANLRIGAKSALAPSLAIVGLWIVLGIVWVVVNPNKGHAQQVHDSRRRSSTPVPV